MYGIEVEGSIKFSRRMLVACTTGLEFLIRSYNPFELQLEGWSESIMEDIDSYDGVFEELYAKYRTKMQMAPEVKLIMMLGGSAMMFHLTNSMFKAAIPNVNDILKQNPGLAQSMMSAVKNTVPRAQTAQQQAAPPTGEEYEMSGPGIEIVPMSWDKSIPGPLISYSSPVGGAACCCAVWALGTVFFTAYIIDCASPGFCFKISLTFGIAALNILFVKWNIIAEPPNIIINLTSGAICILALYFA
jgi:hypothetical protein